MRLGPALLASLLAVGCGQTFERVVKVEEPRAVPVEPVVAPVPVAPPPEHERVPRPPARDPEPPAPPDAGEPIRPPALPRIEPVRGRLAVVIGIDRYPTAPDLTAAVADARTVARALDRLGYDRVRVLLDERATRPAILSSLEWLATSGSREPGVLFFAGHVRRFDGDPDRDGEDRDEALLAADGAVVYDGEVARALEPTRRPLWLAYAACFAGGFSDAAGPGRVSTYASAEDRLAYESPELGRSFMVEYMVDRALLGAGIRGVEDMHRYASNQMEGRHRRYRPLQDDRVQGSLLLGEPEPAARPEGGPGLGCLPGLTC